MNGAAISDRPIRRLAGLPEPYEDESLGSWLARLAASHYAGRDDFVRALLQKTPTRELRDYDADSSPALIAELCRRTGWERVRIERLILPARARVPAAKTRVLESYCPTCWAQDRENGTRHIGYQIEPPLGCRNVGAAVAQRLDVDRMPSDTCFAYSALSLSSIVLHV
jgi:hypothetical protein